MPQKSQECDHEVKDFFITAQTARVLSDERTAITPSIFNSMSRHHISIDFHAVLPNGRIGSKAACYCDLIEAIM